MRWLCLAGLVCCGALFGCAVDSPPGAPEVEPLAASDRQANFQFYLDFWFSGVRSTQEEEIAGRRNTQALSFVGREDLIVADRGATLGLPACEHVSGDPITLIVERAADTNIVIINEAHDSPRDRYFIGQVAAALHPLGYETFAAETFNNGAEINHDLVYYDDGFYSAEPIFGRMLSDVKALGYELVAYEQTPAQAGDHNAETPIGERINRREASQVENLMTAIFADDPDREVLIHVGHGHVTERTGDGDVRWMAERLAEATGRDPLTISQTNCIGGGQGPQLAIAQDGYVDMLIGHPPLELVEGRPAWRLEVGDKLVPLPESLLKISEPTIFEARPRDAFVDTVPTDRLLLAPGERLPLSLPPGDYRIDMLTPKGRTGLAPTLITVD